MKKDYVVSIYVRKIAQTLSYKSTLYVPLEFVLENKISLSKSSKVQVFVRFAAVSRFLERILMEHIETNNSL